jgi:hypothetical protein
MSSQPQRLRFRMLLMLLLAGVLMTAAASGSVLCSGRFTVFQRGQPGELSSCVA